MDRTTGRVETSATIAPNIIRYLRLTAEARGHRLDRILHEVGIAPSELDTPGLRVSFRQGSRIIESAVEELGAPHLGLEVGRRQPITASGILGLGMMASPRVIDAVALGLRFQNLAPLNTLEDDPDEWQNHVEWTMWQNRRNSAIFTNDGGKTYTNVNAAKGSVFGNPNEAADV